MTILRKEELRALSTIRLSGAVADLGGEKHSGYRTFFTGDPVFTTVNLASTRPDVVADLEHPLPFADGSFDAVLLINVLEHVFEYRALLAECARITKPGGRVIVVVPWMLPYHPSPRDFHRYSGDALEQALGAAGFAEIRVTALGSGVFAARFVFIERLAPFLSLLQTVVQGVDASFTAVARMLGKKYHPSDYALGYLVTAHRS